ncbi:hypothetical protein AWC20_19210 [Mycobacterium parmense]|nr:hypothetical protein AWC20_19210 [Mycobacterium parmense]
MVANAGQPAVTNPGRAEESLERPVPAADEAAPVQTVISEHQVLLGSAAATAVPPSFESELEVEEPALDELHADAVVAPRKIAWTRLFKRREEARRDRRARPHYPARFESDFIADARMHREMYRL